jgi:hypothetical protein
LQLRNAMQHLAIHHDSHGARALLYVALIALILAATFFMTDGALLTPR